MPGFNPKFHPGTKVTFDDQEIVGTIERVIFARGRIKAIYLVERFLNGQIISAELHEDDLTEVIEDRS